MFLNKHKEGAFTLIEILLVVIIIASLSSMILPRFKGISERAKIKIAKADVTSNIPTALKLYELDNGRYPTTEQGLRALIEKPSIEPIPSNWNGPYLERRALLDPWGREYIYRVPSTHGLDYDLYSLGPDGKDDDNNIGNWD